MAPNDIPLMAICATRQWHFASCIQSLEACGLTRADAEAYAHLAFEVRGGTPRDQAEAELTPIQLRRLDRGQLLVVRLNDCQ